MAKKRTIIRIEDIERLSALQCSEREAAGFFGISLKAFKKLIDEDTDVRDAWENGRESGKVALRRKQYKLASTSASMAIHLGKSWLGQKDSISLEHTGKDGGPIESMDLTQLDSNDRKQLRELLIKSSRPPENLS